MSAKPKTLVSDRGQEMRHRSQNLHQRHMSDVRGATGCYYCWIGQYNRCKNQCQLVRVTDRDHRLAQSGGAADHRDVLYGWDHSAPVLTHAAAQSNTFFNVPAPKEADKWVKSAAGAGGKLFLGREDFVSVTRHVPENNPWLTASRRQGNRELLGSISSNVNKAEAQRIEAHRRKHEKKLFSLLAPEQFVPLYKYPRSDTVTVQATPYTHITMKQSTTALQRSHQQRLAARAASASPQRRETLDGWGVYDDDGEVDPLDAAAEARARATEQRKRNEQTLRSANRPIFMQTKHGGRYVSSGSAIFSGSAVTARGANGEFDSPEEQRFAEEQRGFGGGTPAPLSTAEQLRAALEGRSVAALQQERLELLRARSAGAGMRGSSSRNPSAANPAVRMEQVAGQVLSGRFSDASSMPLPDSFAF